MNKQEYNGWTNYETWVVSLWMDNDRGSHDYWLEAARTVLENTTEATEYYTVEERARFYLSDILKQTHEDELPEIKGFAADLLNAAMSEVNWYEIAEHLVEGVKEAA
jgi:hypothetical protein